MLPLNRNPSPAVLRGFARLWFPLFVVVVGGAVRWRFGQPAAAAVVWTLGAAVAVLVLASPRAARAVFVGLMIVTYPLGVVISTVALALLFYLVFTPLGWGMRLAGRDALGLRARRERSQWQASQQETDVKRLFRQF